jgi:hypothetical protein
MTRPQPIELLSEQELHLLEELLFDPRNSRNRQFVRFTHPPNRRLHLMARHLLSVRREILDPNSKVWLEYLSEQLINIHIHRPNIGLSRKISLSRQQWVLLQHPRWHNPLPTNF